MTDGVMSMIHRLFHGRVERERRSEAARAACEAATQACRTNITRANELLDEAGKHLKRAEEKRESFLQETQA